MGKFYNLDRKGQAPCGCCAAPRPTAILRGCHSSRTKNTNNSPNGIVGARHSHLWNSTPVRASSDKTRSEVLRWSVRLLAVAQPSVIIPAPCGYPVGHFAGRCWPSLIDWWPAGRRFIWHSDWTTLSGFCRVHYLIPKSNSTALTESRLFSVN